MKKIFQFGEEVKGYNIKVLNEREVRAAAGILFVLLFISVMLALLKADFLMIKYSITIFLLDIIIRVFVNPKFAPTLIIGRLIVRKQNPEYVGALQKKFAWSFGAFLSGIAFVLMVILNTFSPVTGLICMICLLFLLFESAFGICLGCIIYKIVYRKNAEYCPGETCDVKSKEETQKTSLTQIVAVLCFIIWVLIVSYIFNDTFRKKPHDLFGEKVKISILKVNADF